MDGQMELPKEDTETVRCPRGYPQSRFELEHSGLLFGAAKSPAWYRKAWGGGGGM